MNKRSNLAVEIITFRVWRNLNSDLRSNADFLASFAMVFLIMIPLLELPT